MSKHHHQPALVYPVCTDTVIRAFIWIGSPDGCWCSDLVAPANKGMSAEFRGLFRSRLAESAYLGLVFFRRLFVNHGGEVKVVSAPDEGPMLPASFPE